MPPTLVLPDCSAPKGADDQSHFDSTMMTMMMMMQTMMMRRTRTRTRTMDDDNDAADDFDDDDDHEHPASLEHQNHLEKATRQQKLV